MVDSNIKKQGNKTLSIKWQRKILEQKNTVTQKAH